jgi:hypothetical protein
MDYPDTFYHVLSRGNERRKIFRDTEDYKIETSEKRESGFFTHQEIGQVFGVGYTSISGALKCARSYIDSDKKLKAKLDEILIDI